MCIIYIILFPLNTTSLISLPIELFHQKQFKVILIHIY